jgi:chemotaxis protein MotB
MREKIVNQIDNSPRLKKYKSQLKIDVTDEGLRVLITDEANRPMFANASAEMQAYAQEIIKAIAPTFNELPNTISISGHTDSMPFANNNGTYTNWELSADRANAARRVLLAGGLKPDHLLRITGLADAVLLDPANPMNPINRRISIILLNKAAEMAVRNEGKLKTTEIAPSRELDPPPSLPIPEQKVPPVTEPIVKSENKIQEPTLIPPKVVSTPPATPAPSKTENQTKQPAFVPIPKNQIIQLEKPIPSKN